jgi:transposase InsO family protein
MLKRRHPEWGVDRLHDVLWRSEGYQPSSGAIRRVLVEAGYTIETVVRTEHAEPRPRSFERARANQLWQTDLFTFTLKREGRRLWLVIYLDDYSRFVVGQGVSASAAGTLVREALENAIADYGPPEEVLTDNGPQYHTWRGKSAFRKLLDRRGIRHVVARPRHPQTLGKTERFWRTLWEECAREAVFRDVEDARRRISHFIDHYNFQRTHQGIDGLIPADRYFGAESEVRRAAEERIARNALDLARHGDPRKTFYLTGRVGDESIALHGAGGKVVLTRAGEVREEVDLQATGRRTEPQGEKPDDKGSES